MDCMERNLRCGIMRLEASFDELFARLPVLPAIPAQFLFVRGY